MKFTYDNLSSGYLGEESQRATLNSQYYYELFNDISKSSEILSHIIVFPQRVPRAGFFDELLSLETNDFQDTFKHKINFIKNEFKKSKYSLTEKNNNENARIYLNWANILLRYGLFNEINEIGIKESSGPLSLEIQILNETSKIETLLSTDSPIILDGLLSLANTNIKHSNIREKMILLNRLIVYYYRYQKKSSYHKDIVKFSKCFLDLIQLIDDNEFINTLYLSVAYRGLAMATDFGSHLQDSFLAKSENLARNIKSHTNREKIVGLENLYTCLLTMSKWNLIQGDIKKAENYLLEMINLDPFDSTAYSELGFLYLKNEQYDKATDYFKEAMKLGPPGAGMNCYYFAKCLEKRGDHIEAIKYLYTAAELDHQALSPWLDLFDFYNDNRQLDKASLIANHIYRTPILKEQLEEDEIKNIKKFIN